MPTRWLLIEIGNTHTRFAPATGSKLGSRRVMIATRDLDATSLRKATARFNFDCAVLCSVVPDASRVVRRLFSDSLLEISSRCNLGFSLVGYPNPKSIGTDRLANVAGALAARVRLPLVAVDAGTATTFDVLDAAGRFAGGVIAPGPEAFTGYLRARGAQLPDVHANPKRAPRILGRSTAAAIAAAAVHGYRGMAAEILGQIRSATGARNLVVAGGAADWIGTLKGWSVRREPDLTFRGMLAIALRNS